MSDASHERSARRCAKCGYYNAANVPGCYDCEQQFASEPGTLKDILPPASSTAAYTVLVVLLILFQVLINPALVWAARSFLPNRVADVLIVLFDIIGFLAWFATCIVLGIGGILAALVALLLLVTINDRRKFARDYVNAPTNVLKRKEAEANVLLTTLPGRTAEVEKALQGTSEPAERFALEGALRQLNKQQKVAEFILCEVEFKRWQNKVIYTLRRVASGQTRDLAKAHEQIDALTESGSVIRCRLGSAARSAEADTLLESHTALDEALAQGREVLRRRHVTQLVSDAAGMSVSPSSTGSSDLARLEAESCRQLLRLVEGEVKREQTFEFARVTALETLR